MQATELLNQITIPTRCSQDWNSMHGSERARYCGVCQKHVYNLSSMTADEIESLFQSAGENPCGRIFERTDGTVVTADCPPPTTAAKRNPWQVSLRAVIGIVTACATALGIGRVIPEEWFSPTPKPTVTRKLEMMGKMMRMPIPANPNSAATQAAPTCETPGAAN